MKKKKQLHKKIFSQSSLPIIKRSLYILLFFLLSMELFNVYAQYFIDSKETYSYPQPISVEEPVTVDINEISPEPTEQQRVLITPTPTGEWGKARQIDEHTWTIRVGEDKHMGTPEEIFQALNKYRAVHNSPPLIWDEKLAAYAKERTDYFSMIKSTDKHAGFSDFVNNQDGFEKLGFNGLGENSSYGFHVEGVHLIEWVYAGDEPHNRNQLNPEWTHVGIGVTGTATNLVFGKK